MTWGWDPGTGSPQIKCVWARAHARPRVQACAHTWAKHMRACTHIQYVRMCHTLCAVVPKTFVFNTITHVYVRTLYLDKGLTSLPRWWSLSLELVLLLITGCSLTSLQHNYHWCYRVEKPTSSLTIVLTELDPTNSKKYSCHHWNKRCWEWPCLSEAFSASNNLELVISDLCR